MNKNFSANRLGLALLGILFIGLCAADIIYIIKSEKIVASEQGIIVLAAAALPIVGFIYVFISQTLKYLGGETRGSPEEAYFFIQLEELRHELLNEIRRSKAEIGERIRGYSDLPLVEIERKLLDSLSEDTITQIADKWDIKYRSQLEDDKYLTAIRHIGAEMQMRLLAEIAALGRRSNLNLVIGFLVSFSGISALGWFVYLTAFEMSAATSNASEVLLKFGMRLSFVLFVEVFAYFFLRLYRYAIFEIKYFQNEITGAQFRLMALEAALRSGDKAIIEKMCAEMSKAERNFTLKKGESTIELRREEEASKHDPRLWALFEAIVREKSAVK